MGYAGGIYDRATRFTRFGVRDYDPVEGRWVAKDPLGFGGGSPGLYAYCANSPVSFVDLNGLLLDGAAAAAAAAAAASGGGAGAGAGGGAAAAGGAAVGGAVAGVALVGFGVGLAIGAAINELASHQIDDMIDGGLSIFGLNPNPDLGDATASRGLAPQASRDGTPGNNRDQNRQFQDAVREIERRLGRRLSADEKRRLHDAISGCNLGFWDLVEEGMNLFQ